MSVLRIVTALLASSTLMSSAYAQVSPKKSSRTIKPSSAPAAAINPNILLPFGPITKTENRKATASKSTRAISFTMASGSGIELAKPGQPVWLSMDGKTAAYVKFPLAIPYGKDCVGKGPGKGCFRMETRDGRVSNTGLISGRTHTISEDFIEGFTGQVWIKLFDRTNNELAVERTGCFGVNPRQGRNDVWRIQLDTLVVRNAARAEIWHARSGCGRDRWDEVLDKAKKGAEVVAALYKAATSSDSTNTSTPTQPKQ